MTISLAKHVAAPNRCQVKSIKKGKDRKADDSEDDIEKEKAEAEILSK